MSPCHAVTHARVTRDAVTCHTPCHAVPSRPVPSHSRKRDLLWSVVSEFGFEMPLRPKWREVLAA